MLKIIPQLDLDYIDDDFYFDILKNLALTMKDVLVYEIPTLVSSININSKVEIDQYINQFLESKIINFLAKIIPDVVDDKNKVRSIVLALHTYLINLFCAQVNDSTENIICRSQDITNNIITETFYLIYHTCPTSLFDDIIIEFKQVEASNT